MNLPYLKIWPVEGVLIFEYVLGCVLKHLFFCVFVNLFTASWIFTKFGTICCLLQFSLFILELNHEINHFSFRTFYCMNMFMTLATHRSFYTKT